MTELEALRKVVTEMKAWTLKTFTRPTVIGRWVLNDYHDEDSEDIDYQVPTTTVDFTSAGVEFTSISHDGDGIFYDDAYVWYQGSWENQAYRTVDFGTEPQEVSSEFYKWLTANATPLNTVTLNYSLSGSIDCGVISADDIEPIDLSTYCDLDSGEYEFTGTLSIETNSNTLTFTCGSGYATLITDSAGNVLHGYDEDQGFSLASVFNITIPEDGIINLSHWYY